MLAFVAAIRTIHAHFRMLMTSAGANLSNQMGHMKAPRVYKSMINGEQG